MKFAQAMMALAATTALPATASESTPTNNRAKCETPSQTMSVRLQRSTVTERQQN